MRPAVKFLPCGDRALSVEFGNEVDRRLSAAVLSLAARIEAAPPAGVAETVPTFRSLLVHYDPLKTSSSQLCTQIEALVEPAAEIPGTTRLWLIPTCYEDELAPDLSDVARRAGLAPAEVIAAHGAVQYYIYMLGFLPGFPYMGDLPETLQLPRREDPRKKVPAGSVAIAANMTAIYTFESPGGWHIIGRTPIPMFDMARAPPTLLHPGDTARFEAISRAEYDRLQSAVADGSFSLQPALKP